jgi:hypothetical protein
LHPEKEVKTLALKTFVRQQAAAFKVPKKVSVCDTKRSNIKLLTFS